MKFTEMKFDEKHTSFHNLDTMELINTLKGQKISDIQTIGIISCQNPQMSGAKEYSEIDNKRAIDDFTNYLRGNGDIDNPESGKIDGISNPEFGKRGFQYQPVTGFFDGREHTFMIKNISEPEMEYLAAKNYQLSFIFGERKDSKFILTYYETKGMKDPKENIVYRYESKGTDVLDDRTFSKSKDIDNYYTKIKGTKYQSHFPYFDETSLSESKKDLFEKIYEECVCAGTGAGSISSFAPEHMVGMSLGPNTFIHNETDEKKKEVKVPDLSVSATLKDKE